MYSYLNFCVKLTLKSFKFDTVIINYPYLCTIGYYMALDNIQEQSEVAKKMSMGFQDMDEVATKFLVLLSGYRFIVISRMSCLKNSKH